MFYIYKNYPKFLFFLKKKGKKKEEKKLKKESHRMLESHVMRKNY